MRETAADAECFRANQHFVNVCRSAVVRYARQKCRAGRFALNAAGLGRHQADAPATLENQAVQKRLDVITKLDLSQKGARHTVGSAMRRLRAGGQREEDSMTAFGPSTVRPGTAVPALIPFATVE
jgi:hypothetical protein